MTGRVPVLMYHGVSAATLTSITPALFAQQMSMLHRAGVRVLPLHEVVDRLHRNLPLPFRALAITFDDGLRSVYDAAWPVLRRFGFPATVFLVANYLDRDNGWPGQPPQVKPEPMLTWSQVRELDRDGLEMAAHTLDHPRLDLLAEDAVRAQVAGSRTAIESQLGHEITLFAYPYGRHTPAVRAIAGESFTGACTARPGFVKDGSDPLRLDRIDVGYLTTHPFLFRALLNPAFPLYLAVRRLLRSAGVRLLARPWA
jgi:peptidoglycan/xylan/chitin deacetylase (PgdA/CDA1 family)